MNWWQRLRRTDQVEQHLDAELRDHFERQVAESVNAGIPVADARRQARLNFGGMEQIKEECRDARGTAWVETTLQDLRFALRMLHKNPGFAVAAVATLAIGIGANATMYSVVSGVLLKPLAYRDPGRLVTVLNQNSNPVSPADFLDYQRQSTSFEHLSAVGAWSATLTGYGQPEELIGQQVSEGTFEMLGVAPALGRFFTSDEAQPGKGRVLMLSDSLWRRRFAADPAILGRTITLSGEPYTIVGVMPPGFRFTPFWITDAELWLPLSLADRANDRGGQFIRGIGRLKPNATLTGAQSEMSIIAARLARQYPAEDALTTVEVESLHEHTVGSLRAPLLALMGAVAFVLLIACTNIANLTLARASQRRKEIAIRIAVGAGRIRLFRQVLTESLLLSTIGGAFGLLLAFLGTGALRTFLHAGGGRFRGMPRIDEIRLDATVLLGVVTMVVFSAMLLGLLPALRIARGNAGESLKESARGSSGFGGMRLRSILIVAELAISLVLLTGAGLLIRSFVQLRSVPMGFAAHDLLSMTVSVAGQPQYAGQARINFYRQAMARAAAIPGVRSVAMVNHIPLGGDTWGGEVFGEGVPESPPGHGARVIFRSALPNYFQTMETPILRGRDFSDRDTLDAPPVAIVNRTLARMLWGDADVVGKRVTLHKSFRPEAAITIIGVVGDVRQQNLDKGAEPEVYTSILQEKQYLGGQGHATSYLTLVARTGVAPESVSSAITKAIWGLNPDLAISDVRSFDRIIASQLWQPTLETSVLGFFAGFALLLAAVGIYGVMAYSVSLRTQEIGIRMALGAGKGTVLWMIVRHGAVLAVGGIAIGTGLALLLTRFLAGMLFGVTPTDGATFLAIPFVLAAVALLASLIPARRAAGIDAMSALRGE